MRPVLDWIKVQYQTAKARHEVVKDYHRTFEANGARVLEDLRRFCRVYETTHVTGDSHGSAINEGKRQAYLHIVNMLETSLEEVKPKPEKGPIDDRDAERTEISDD